MFAIAGVMRVLPVLLLAACGSSVAPRAVVKGRVDRSTLVEACMVEAVGDDGAVLSSALNDDGEFELGIALQQAWALRVARHDGSVVPIALARAGHFDRGLMAQGRVDVSLGLVWLPPAGAPALTRVFERDASRCVDGRLDDGAPCAVLESLVTCADGPVRPAQTPALFLATERPDGVAVTSRVPPEILWECAPTPLP